MIEYILKHENIRDLSGCFTSLTIYTHEFTISVPLWRRHLGSSPSFSLNKYASYCYSCCYINVFFIVVLFLVNLK